MRFSGILVSIVLGLSAPMGLSGAWAQPARGRGQFLDYSQVSSKRIVDWSSAEALLKSFRFDRVTLVRARFHGARLVGFRFDLSEVIDSDFRNAQILDLLAFRTRFLRCDFRGADLRGSAFVLSQFPDSLFDDSTKLPFSREVAEGLGMKYAQP